jgi:class 3 adenylate cyclase
VSPIQIPKNDSVSAFALILDINGFTKMVANKEAILIADFVRDALYGSIQAVEKNDGDVVGFMGDGFLAIIESPEQVFKACVAIAKDIDKQCEYLSNSKGFLFTPKGVSVKIGIEYGYLDISEISSNFLGKQKLFISEAINYAARITTSREKGNRCLVGPKAFEMGLKVYCYDVGYSEVKGKPGEDKYLYYKMNLGDIWKEDKLKETYWS